MQTALLDPAVREIFRRAVSGAAAPRKPLCRLIVFTMPSGSECTDESARQHQTALSGKIRKDEMNIFKYIFIKIFYIRRSVNQTCSYFFGDTVV
jgi:hypothetical protein